ncbi:MAG: ROK family transcriptional regulator [Anaerolineaceae bacterium]|nr:ROK family transcriptional regulator [Anaerolineaceae bacterium]
MKATREYLKRHNSELVLKTIYDHVEISRADIARITRLTRTTVSEVVNNLIEDGLVEELGYGPSAGGTPPMIIRVVKDWRSIIGIDLANDEFRGGLINLRGEIEHWECVPIHDSDGEAAKALIFQLIDQLMKHATRPVMGIGVGTPGFIDTQNGIVIEAVNLDWRQFPLQQLLKDRYQVPVLISNDSQVAALGEYTFGDPKDDSNLIVMKVGRGIGAGIVVDHHIYYGDGSHAGAIGHVVVKDEGDLCRCGHCGCLETVSSSRAIVKQCKKYAAMNPNSPLNQVADINKLSTDDVIQIYNNGDPAVIEIVHRAAHYLGVVIAHMIGSMNINRFLISGSVSRFGEQFLDVIRKTVKARVLPAQLDGLRIEEANLETEAIALGAAAMLMAKELGIV